ncbi:MAG TPA: hypothetical protein VD884_15735 [Ohtaekwangia sp.]|nr:hypothetical protein [Ohtaekwangia sp.]
MKKINLAAQRGFLQFVFDEDPRCNQQWYYVQSSKIRGKENNGVMNRGH